MTDVNQGYHDARHLEHLAGRCERGAEELAREADNAAAVLATRAGGDRIAPDEWAAQKRSAAAAARAYARELRAEAAAVGKGPVSKERIDQAERVAGAAELGGILVDSRPVAERSAASGSVFYEPDRAAWEAGTHPAQQKAAAVEGSGVFEHVDETIDGVKQVPFWRLAAPVSEDATEAGDERAGVDDTVRYDSAGDADEM